ncbi:uncharacterized protein [Triticum aestivum]|uniref:uncharacterized protein n=1 Tax=Triticum aestivum TaxID=4565 RepID=UPI001D02B7A3|nr:uncharacterized protein LOC123160087 [Triticum aestivum]
MESYRMEKRPQAKHARFHHEGIKSSLLRRLAGSTTYACGPVPKEVAGSRLSAGQVDILGYKIKAIEHTHLISVFSKILLESQYAGLQEKCQPLVPQDNGYDNKQESAVKQATTWWRNELLDFLAKHIN